MNCDGRIIACDAIDTINLARLQLVDLRESIEVRGGVCVDVGAADQLVLVAILDIDAALADLVKRLREVKKA